MLHHCFLVFPLLLVSFSASASGNQLDKVSWNQVWDWLCFSRKYNGKGLESGDMMSFGNDCSSLSWSFSQHHISLCLCLEAGFKIYDGIIVLCQRGYPNTNPCCKVQGHTGVFSKAKKNLKQSGEVLAPEWKNHEGLWQFSISNRFERCQRR